jgi:hypothetical protein
MITRTKKDLRPATIQNENDDSRQMAPNATNPHTLEVPMAHISLRGQTMETIGLVGHDEAKGEPS